MVIQDAVIQAAELLRMFLSDFFQPGCPEAGVKCRQGKRLFGKLSPLFRAFGRIQRAEKNFRLNRSTVFVIELVKRGVISVLIETFIAEAQIDFVFLLRWLKTLIVLRKEFFILRMHGVAHDCVQRSLPLFMIRLVCDLDIVRNRLFAKAPCVETRCDLIVGGAGGICAAAEDSCKALDLRFGIPSCGKFGRLQEGFDLCLIIMLKRSHQFRAVIRAGGLLKLCKLCFRHAGLGIDRCQKPQHLFTAGFLRSSGRPVGRRTCMHLFYRFINDGFRAADPPQIFESAQNTECRIFQKIPAYILCRTGHLLFRQPAVLLAVDRFGLRNFMAGRHHFRKLCQRMGFIQTVEQSDPDLFKLLFGFLRSDNFQHLRSGFREAEFLLQLFKHAVIQTLCLGMFLQPADQDNIVGFGFECERNLFNHFRTVSVHLVIRIRVEYQFGRSGKTHLLTVLVIETGIFLICLFPHAELLQTAQRFPLIRLILLTAVKHFEEPLFRSAVQVSLCLFQTAGCAVGIFSLLERFRAKHIADAVDIRFAQTFLIQMFRILGQCGNLRDVRVNDRLLKIGKFLFPRRLRCFLFHLCRFVFRFCFGNCRSGFFETGFGFRFRCPDFFRFGLRCFRFCKVGKECRDILLQRFFIFLSETRQNGRRIDFLFLRFFRRFFSGHIICKRQHLQNTGEFIGLFR